jgi:hypothetical protein
MTISMTTQFAFGDAKAVTTVTNTKREPGQKPERHQSKNRNMQAQKQGKIPSPYFTPLSFRRGAGGEASSAPYFSQITLPGSSNHSCTCFANAFSNWLRLIFMEGVIRLFSTVQGSFTTTSFCTRS